MLSRGATRLLQLIQKFITRYGKFFASQVRIADWLRVTERTVRRWTKELIQAGLIVTQRRSQNTMLYSILPAKMSDQVTAQISAQVSGRYKEELSNQNNESKRLTWPEATITNEYGRTDPNPEYQHLQAIMRNAQKRIMSARDPVAYEQAILRAELRALRKPAAREGLSLRRPAAESLD